MTGDGNRDQTILEQIRDGVYTLDSSGQITWVNETAVENFDIGYTRDELVGAPVSKVLTDADVEKCLSIIRTLLRSDERESGRCEIRLQTASGDSIPCDLHLALLSPEDGEFQGTVGVVRDITNRKQREQRLDVLNRILRHDLSNAMTVILGRIQQLEDGVDPEFQPAIDAIRERGEELIETSEKVRQVHHIHNEMADQQGSLELCSLVESIVDDFRVTYPAVDFDVDIPSDAHAATGHEELVTTAFSNLVENAIEHNDSDRPLVLVTIQKDHDRVQIRIEDNGPGIPSEEREILEMGSESKLRHSMGIGLWLAYWSVTACNGDIRFDDDISQGTVVLMEFPRATASDQ